MNVFEPQLSLSDRDVLSIFSNFSFYINAKNEVTLFCQFSGDVEFDILNIENHIDNIFNNYNFFPCKYDYISSNKVFSEEVKSKVDYERLHRVYTYSCIDCNKDGAGKDLRIHIDDTVKYFIDEDCPLCNKQGLYIQLAF